MPGSRNYTYDQSLLLKDAGAITASAAAQVAAANRIIDMGTARFDGQLVIWVTALTVGATNQYQILAQGSSSATFASDIQTLGTLELGNTAVRLGGAITSLVGGYEFGFTNEQADVTYRYIRLFTVCVGTSPSINYTAFLAPESGM